MSGLKPGSRSVILLGAPGAGKGTQAAQLAEQHRVPHISTGEMFRASAALGTGPGLKAQRYLHEGQLVPDEVVIDLVKDRLAREDCAHGFILDGFPRTVPQAEALEELLAALGRDLGRAFFLDLPDPEVVRRLSSRRICVRCGASYNLVSRPPVSEGRCEACGGDLAQREDDREGTVLRRLQVYRTSTAPLISWYEERGRLSRINGMGAVTVVFQELARLVEARA